jgi:oxygen-independent coproporphyrinogen III oxidase
MAGIYIHIPFCKQACNYCNFHFSTQVEFKQEMVDAICHELALRKDYLLNETIESIYIGGGTPSLLTDSQLGQLFETVSQHFSIANLAEITLETNPDDLTPEKIATLRQTPINRFSIGVQSFFDEELKWMNRAHSAAEAKQAIARVQDAGFENITIDLIYGSPTLTTEKWQANLQTAIDLQLNHISSYCLTVEPKTTLDHLIKTKKIIGPNEEQAAAQFEMLVKTLEANGFEQYEISNFARNEQYAVHNTNYWKNKLYLGVGPSAHSFNKQTRSWNIANNPLYVKGITKGTSVSEVEELTTENRINEYIMTSLRTIWGLDENWFSLEFPEVLTHKVKLRLEEKITEGSIQKVNGFYSLTPHSRIMADGIAADLFV